MSEFVGKDGVEIDSRYLACGMEVDIGNGEAAPRPKDAIVVVPPVQIRVAAGRGRPFDLAFGGLGVPVATDVTTGIIQSYGYRNMQAIPAYVKGVDGGFSVINITRRISCLDIQRSIIDWGGKQAGPSQRPVAIFKIVVDPSAIGDNHIFRLQGWESALIVSEALKAALEDSGVRLGVKFTKV